jgi:hypothetical protein
LAPTTFVNGINVPVFLAGAWQDEQTGGYFPTMLDHFTGTDKLHFTLTNGNHTDSLAPAIVTRWTEFLSFYVRQEVPHLPETAKLALQLAVEQVFRIRTVPIEPDRFSDAPSFEAALARYEAEPKVRILFDNGAGAQLGSPVAGFEQSFERWPIPTVEPSIWYFADGGKLESTPPTSDGADAFAYDPSRSQDVTFQGSNSNDIWLALPPWHWQSPEAGKALSYVTDPLSDTAVMAGSGSVDLWLNSTVRDTDVQVTLSEVRPDGMETYVQNGWLRASHRKLNDAASSVLRPVHTYLASDAAKLPQDGYVLARVELFPFAHVFRAGSRIRLTVESPGGDRPLWKFDVLPADGAVTNTVARSAAHPSRVVLPLVPGIDVPTQLPPCPALRGQPCRAYEELANTQE